MAVRVTKNAKNVEQFGCTGNLTRTGVVSELQLSLAIVTELAKTNNCFYDLFVVGNMQLRQFMGKIWKMKNAPTTLNF